MEIFMWLTVLSSCCMALTAANVVAGGTETMEQRVARLENVVYWRNKLDFRQLSGIEISNGDMSLAGSVSRQKTVQESKQCLDVCLGEFGKDCGYYSFSRHTRQCKVYNADFYDTWTQLVASAGVDSYYHHKPDSWKIVFSRPKQVKVPGYTSQVSGPWLDAHFVTPSISSAGLLTTVGAGARVVKSPAVSFWSQLNINKVKVGVFSGGEEVKHILFSGVGANSLTWFSREKLLSSSWSTLQSHSKPFYLDWWYKSGNGIKNRGMYVPQSHRGCASDWVYFVALQDQSDAACDWERVPLRDLPKILYSPSTTAANRTDNMLEADSVIISIQM